MIYSCRSALILLHVLCVLIKLWLHVYWACSLYKWLDISKIWWVNVLALFFLWQVSVGILNVALLYFVYLFWWWHCHGCCYKKIHFLIHQMWCKSWMINSHLTFNLKKKNSKKKRNWNSSAVALENHMVKF